MPIHQECRQRLARLQQLLQRQELDGALFLYPIDIYYFAATRQNGLLWVPATGDPLLLVRKSLARARQESAVADLRPFPSSRDLSGLVGRPGQRIGLTHDVLPIAQLTYLHKVLPERSFHDIAELNRKLRSVKSAWELERLRRAGDQLSAVFAEVPEFLRPGLREIDLAAEFECRLRKRGGEGYVRMRAFNQELFLGLAVAVGADQPGFFDGAVTGRGLSAAAPHGASQAPIAANAPVLIDYVGVFDGYLVDMTRMFVCGSLEPQLEDAFSCALQIQEQLSSTLKPGVLCSELFELSARLAAEAGLGECYMGVPGEQAKFVGHGIGLELDELPILARGVNVPLEAGQTIAIEPKFVLPGCGAIGIENTWAVGRDGGIRLTGHPDELVRL